MATAISAEQCFARSKGRSHLRHRVAISLATTCCFAFCIGTARTAEAADEGGPHHLVLHAYNPVTFQADVTEDGRKLHLLVNDPDARKLAAAAQVGDVLDTTADENATPGTISAINKLGRPVNPWAVSLALIGSAVGLLIAATIAAWGQPLRFIIDKDGQISNSQFQLALWFSVVACAYSAAFCLRIAYLGWDYVGGVNLTDHVMALTGLSAFTFATAKAIATQKAKEAKENEANGMTRPRRAPLSALNLMTNVQGDTDLGDFQMALITLVAAGIFVIATIKFLMCLEVAKTTLMPDVDTTLLASFGLGQGAYLAKKAALPPNEG